MVYLRIPPITITALLIIYWTVDIKFHNKKTNTLENISNSTFLYDDSNFNKILNSKNIFKKKILKTNNNFVNKIDNANDLDEVLRLVADIQGWFIGKDKFSWMWLNKKICTQDFYKQIFNNVCYIAQRKILNFYL